MDWLNNLVVRNRNWPLVWFQLWDSDLGSKLDLVSIADRLIVQSPPNSIKTIRLRIKGPAAVKPAWRWSNEWQQRWRVSVSNFAQRKAVAEEAIEWLSKLDLSQAGWSTVWLTLWRSHTLTADLPNRLSELAIQWLKLANVQHPQWSKVWKAAWEASIRFGLDQTELVEMANRAILATPPLRQWLSILEMVWEKLLNNDRVDVTEYDRIRRQLPPGHSLHKGD